MPLVSVIIPVYNVAPYLKRCMDSIVNQTLSDIEIICINDCSTDNSLDILKEYSSKDNRIKLIDLPQNQGTSVARNKGLEIAKGKYIGFIDSDDTIDLNFYEELYKKAAETNADIVKGTLVYHNLNGIIKKGRMNKLIKEKGRFNFIYEFTSAIYKASLIFENQINFSPDIKLAEDALFLNNVVLKSKSFELIDNVNYHYYRRFDSADSKKIPLNEIESSLEAYERITDSLNASLGKDILDNEYLFIYFLRMNTILDHTIGKSDMVEAKRLCSEKYIQLFNKCKKQAELEAKFLPVYKDMLNYIKNNDVDKLTNIFLNFKNLQQYFLFKLKNRVKEDLCKTKQMVT